MFIIIIIIITIFISVKTNRSTNMIIYIHTRTAVTQDRNNRFSEVGCQTAAPECDFLPRNHSPDGATKADIRLLCLLLIYLLRKDERLSWPSWLTCSGRFTHIVVTRRLQAEHRTGSVRWPKTGVLPTVLRNQPIIRQLLRKNLAS